MPPAGASCDAESWEAPAPPRTIGAVRPAWVFALMTLSACGGSGSEWVAGAGASRAHGTALGADPPWSRSAARPALKGTIRIAAAPAPREPLFDDPDDLPPLGEGGPFRNTYYHFPTDEGPGEVPLFDAQCRPIEQVSRAFHDSVCMQGSGKLASGATVSFARRDCACASVCPRSGEKICFERLDPNRYPWGRGAAGTAITPLRTVAVDSSLIPLGSRVFIPEAVGLPTLDGSPHDGCFVAEDRGGKVIGQHVDLFTGDPSMTQLWNARLPTNHGVNVVVGSARCGG